ncbi:hypothetical protein [Acetivibrio saccincola]|uniref:Uncharacterized protein n=1 Tax=Acetivibrio saccincola TaxID=1677857 RepID=A0A2S8R9D5_9FIRM|nr:hypothetical protein [Acetivibrio saccincola]PQQ66394.1 hypothetical protein B9R14_06275 [Acetivibrio saccincola]
MQILKDILSRSLDDLLPLTKLIADINKDEIIDEMDFSLLDQTVNSYYIPEFFVDCLGRSVDDFSIEEAEAKHLALYLTDEIFPPEDLVEKISGELSGIREIFGADIPQLKETYHFNYNKYYNANLLINFNEETLEKVIAGEYNEWDDLNKIYGVQLIKIYNKNVTLIFNDVLSNQKLVNIYKELPGITRINTLSLVLIYQPSTVHIKEVDGYRRYTFVIVDSPDNELRHVFEVRDNYIEYINKGKIVPLETE